MKTLFEELLYSDISKVFDSRSIMSPRDFIENLNQTELIKAQSVADYYFEGTSQDEWGIFEDFPNAAPVFENMFIEFQYPTRILLQDKVLLSEPGTRNAQAGIFIGAKEDNRGPENIRWCLNCLIFAKTKANGIKLAPVYFFIFVDKNGHPVPGPGRNGQVTYMIENFIPKEEQSFYYSMFCSPIHIALLTLSFMHCKNIQKIEHNPHTPGKRNHNTCHIKHYTLEIDPMRKILESEGGSAHNGIKKALHICRGHFKTFSEEKPLLGKAVGTFWWADHMRGLIQNGLIDKDYDVKSVK